MDGGKKSGKIPPTKGNRHHVVFRWKSFHCEHTNAEQNATGLFQDPKIIH